MKAFVNSFLNALFPNNIKCIVCDKELNQTTHFDLCDECMQNMPLNAGKTCIKCGEKINSRSKYCLRCKHYKPKFKQCFSPLLYEKPVTYLIKNFKYNNKQYLSQPLGNFLVQTYILNNLNCDIVLPVPLHEKRLKQRGFNQSELLANQLGQKLNLPVTNEILKRVKNTKTQTNLTKQERQQNVKNAFKVFHRGIIKNKTVLLIDDVYTTGSTLNECAKVLLKAGAKEVYCLTLAHTLNEKI